jgi:hypothetical protein
MARTALAVALVVAVLTLAGCATEPMEGGDDHDPPAAGRAIVLPASAFPRMSSSASSIDVEGLANEVAHPDQLRATLDEAGFDSAAQRSFGGGTGAFSRVLARGMTFESEAGAASYVAWFADNAHEEITSSRRILPPGLADDVVVYRHQPDGCCHNDVPAYVAAWQRGSSVLYLHAGGRRANTHAFVELIESYDQEV